MASFGLPTACAYHPESVGFQRRNQSALRDPSKVSYYFGRKGHLYRLMVVQGPLDFNILLGRDYVYVMGALVSSLFQVVCFPHEGRIVTIDQLSFISHQAPPSQPSSSISSCFQAVPSLPQVNYVATRSVSTYGDDHTDGIIQYVLGHWNPLFHLYQLTCVPPRAWFFHLVMTS